MAAWAAPYDLFDPFEALGLERDADPKSIKSKYRDLARRYHPNRNQGSDEVKASLAEHFHHISQAWQLLSKDDQRRRYRQLLDLYDQHERICASASDLLSTNEHSEHQSAEQKPVQDGHLSSDADDDDLPRLIGVRRRTTLDRPAMSSHGLHDIEEASDSTDRSAERERKPRSRVAQLRRKETGSGESSDQNAAAERRKRFDKLRKKELDAFVRYRDAMVDKFQAEEAAEAFKEQFEQAKWRREYFERAPRETSQRVRLIQLFNAATSAFAAQPQPLRRRNRSTLSSGQILSTGDPFDKNQFLAAPSRNKSVKSRTYTSDITGDQTSSDDNSSDKATSPSRSPRVPARATSPRPAYARHRRWDSLPTVLPVASHSLLPNGNHEPISPITGPGPKLFIRAPTGLGEPVTIQGSDADSASASSRSPSPEPNVQDRGRFTIVPGTGASEIFGCTSDRRSRSHSRDRRANSVNGSKARSRTPPPPVEGCMFTIKKVGQLHFRHIPIDNVHELTVTEKRWMLGAEPDTDMNPHDILKRLSALDKTVASRFMIKPDIKSKFRFRLIYNHREVVKQQHQSFIALSYRRKLHVEKHHKHYTLPLESEMFHAVWDERLSENEGVWIDQICIDGDSEEEKTISMSAMDLVYRSARLVVVALDDIELLPHEGDLLENHMDEFNRQVHVPAKKRFRRRQTPYLESHENLYNVVRKILRSSWFRRAWCRHEMRLARDHIFLIPCQRPGSWSGKSVLRFTGKCLTHFLALATEVPFEPSIEAVKPALYAFFRDRSKLEPNERLRSHHGNFTTVVAEVFAMEAGGDPRIPEEQRQADARKDQISIILNTMECGLALAQRVRNPRINLSTPECNYMLLLLALAARDPGALCSAGHPFRQLPYQLSSSWLLEPTNVDSGLNNYRTLNRLSPSLPITTKYQDKEHFVQLGLKFLKPGKVEYPKEAPETIDLAQRFIEVCDRKHFGRNRKRYLLKDKTANDLFGSMREVYVQTLVAVFECGPDWMIDVCQRYGVGRWKYDLQPAYELLIALKNTHGRWPEDAWSTQAAGFIMDLVNFLVVRGMPQRQITKQELWRPIWVLSDDGAKSLTFIPPGNIAVAVPTALLDPDYVKLARLWVLGPRGERTEEELPYYTEWTLLGKSVIFANDSAMRLLEIDNGFIREDRKVFGRSAASTPSLHVSQH